MAQFQESHETSISSISTLSPEAFVEDVIAESQAAYDRLHDPIAARREAAERNLQSIGLLSELQLAEIGPELQKLTRVELVVARAVIVPIYSLQTGTVREVNRLIIGGYQESPDGTYDAITTHYDSGELVPFFSQEKAADKEIITLPEMLDSLCVERARAENVIPGQQPLERDIYELLVAVGRDKGRPVRDLYRPTGEPPITGVREDPFAHEQSDLGLAA